jgi:hypothetical protein
MQTGQNSIAPENSLPQLEQVRWGSVFMALTTCQPQPWPKATPRSIERWESAGASPDNTTFSDETFPKLTAVNRQLSRLP